MNTDGGYDDIPDHVVHSLLSEADLTADPDVIIVPPKDVRASTGARAEEWRASLEKEFDTNFAIAIPIFNIKNIEHN